VLAAEAAPALAADRVAPDDLVDEVGAPEQAVERDLDVVDGAPVEVDEQRAGGREGVAAGDQPRREPGDVGDSGSSPSSA
jgi:hypothetical protein